MIDTQRAYMSKKYDYQPREQDVPLITEIGGTTHQIRRLVNPDDQLWSATNPSIGVSPKGNYAVMLRSSNYVIMPTGEYRVTTNGTIRSTVWFSELDKDFMIKELKQVDVSDLGVKIERGLEDPKLFWRDGSWHFTCVTMEKDHTPIARMATCRLDTKKMKAFDFVKYPGIDQKRPEKNWSVPYEPNPNFDFIYGPNATIKNNVLTTHMTENENISALRGNTNLVKLDDGTYLGVVHRMFGKAETVWVQQTFGTVNGYIRRYVHYFAQYDNYGKIIAISKGFNFFHSGVEFAAGLVEHKKDLLISWGKKDISSHIASIPKATVLKSLLPLEY